MPRTPPTSEHLILFGINLEDEWSHMGNALTATIEGKWLKWRKKEVTHLLGQVGPAESVICGLSIHTPRHKFFNQSILCHSLCCEMHDAFFFFKKKTRSIFSTFFKTSAITTCTANWLSLSLLTAFSTGGMGRQAFCIAGLSGISLWGDCFTPEGKMALFYTCYFPILQLEVINIC